jgi:hypothetical protein
MKYILLGLTLLFVTSFGICFVIVNLIFNYLIFNKLLVLYIIYFYYLKMNTKTSNIFKIIKIIKVYIINLKVF